MISQLDPLINTCKSGYYSEKKDKIGLIREKEESNESKGGLFESIKKKFTISSQVKVN